MRYTRPLNIHYLVIDCAGIIQVIQRVVFGREALCRQRLAGLVHFMRPALELCKKGLTEYRGTEALQEVIQNICAAARVRLNRQQILCQQHLIDCRSHLSHQDLVFMIDILLGFARLIGMHGVTKFMRQSKGVIERIGIVQKDVRMHAVNAAGERAGRFAVVFIDVNPLFVKSFIQQCGVCFTKRRQCLLYKYLCILIRHLKVDVVHHRGIKIIEMQFFQSQHTAAQIQIAAHNRQSAVDSLNQRIINCNRDVAYKKSSRKRTVKIAHVRVITVKLYRAGIHSRQCILKLTEFAEIRFKRLAADTAVRALTEHTEISVR